ncbi:hypothetical protein HDU93_002696 [Gonapodya sp. JEL0774]|nr:hypothetical protein HDU93_002696 [Gonapodya sp. JEL0774]
MSAAHLMYVNDAGVHHGNVTGFGNYPNPIEVHEAHGWRDDTHIGMYDQDDSDSDAGSDTASECSVETPNKHGAPGHQTRDSGCVDVGVFPEGNVAGERERPWNDKGTTPASSDFGVHARRHSIETLKDKPRDSILGNDNSPHQTHHHSHHSSSKSRRHKNAPAVISSFLAGIERDSLSNPYGARSSWPHIDSERLSSAGRASWPMQTTVNYAGLHEARTASSEASEGQHEVAARTRSGVMDIGFLTGDSKPTTDRSLSPTPSAASVATSSRTAVSPMALDHNYTPGYAPSVAGYVQAPNGDVMEVTMASGRSHSNQHSATGQSRSRSGSSLGGAHKSRRKGPPRLPWQFVDYVPPPLPPHMQSQSQSMHEGQHLPVQPLQGVQPPFGSDPTHYYSPGQPSQPMYSNEPPVHYSGRQHMFSHDPSTMSPGQMYPNGPSHTSPGQMHPSDPSYMSHGQVHPNDSSFLSAGPTQGHEPSNGTPGHMYLNNPSYGSPGQIYPSDPSYGAERHPMYTNPAQQQHLSNGNLQNRFETVPPVYHHSFYHGLNPGA